MAETSGETTVRNPDEPDIGMCDDCGTDWGRRFRTIVDGVWADGPGRCVVWLCGSCLLIRQSEAPR